jgi:hypothetical protein
MPMASWKVCGKESIGMPSWNRCSSSRVNFRKSIEQTTIHLIFVTEELRNTISHCRVAHELIEWQKDCAAAGFSAPTEEDAYAIYLRKDVEAPDLVTIKDFFRFYVKTSTPHNPTTTLYLSSLHLSPQLSLAFVSTAFVSLDLNMDTLGSAGGRHLL